MNNTFLSLSHWFTMIHQTGSLPLPNIVKTRNLCQTSRAQALLGLGKVCWQWVTAYRGYLWGLGDCGGFSRLFCGGLRLFCAPGVIDGEIHGTLETHKILLVKSAVMGSGDLLVQWLWQNSSVSSIGTRREGTQNFNGLVLNILKWQYSRHLHPWFSRIDIRVPFHWSF